MDFMNKDNNDDDSDSGDDNNSGDDNDSGDDNYEHISMESIIENYVSHSVNATVSPLDQPKVSSLEQFEATPVEQLSKQLEVTPVEQLSKQLEEQSVFQLEDQLQEQLQEQPQEQLQEQSQEQSVKQFVKQLSDYVSEYIEQHPEYLKQNANQSTDLQMVQLARPLEESQHDYESNNDSDNDSDNDNDNDNNNDNNNDNDNDFDIDNFEDYVVLRNKYRNYDKINLEIKRLKELRVRYPVSAQDELKKLTTLLQKYPLYSLLDIEELHQLNYKYQHTDLPKVSTDLKKLKIFKDKYPTKTKIRTHSGRFISSFLFAVFPCYQTSFLDQTFIIEWFAKDKIIIKNAANPLYYLTIENSKLRMMRNVIYIFTIKEYEDGFTLQSANDLYLCAEKKFFGEELIVNRQNPGTWEKLFFV